MGCRGVFRWWLGLHGGAKPVTILGQGATSGSGETVTEKTEGAEGAASSEASLEVIGAHEALLADRSYQFEVDAVPERQLPDWLANILDSELLLSVLNVAARVMQVGFWIGLAALAAVLGVFVFRAISARMPAREQQETQHRQAYAPSQASLRDLLSEADRLAATGDHAGAARLLLHRSIEDVAKSRPGSVSRAMTAREIGALDILTDATREAYGAIAALVERSHFAGQPIGGDEYSEARSRYGAIGGTGAS